MEKIKTIKIFSQEWMAEDLNVSYYSNGDPILYANNDQKRIMYENQKKGFYSYHKDNELNGQKYGKLYNWYAMKDPRGIAPEGFRVTTFQDWDRLVDNLGGKDDAKKWFKSKSDLFGLRYCGYGDIEFKDEDNYEFYRLNVCSSYLLSSWNGHENTEVQWRIHTDGFFDLGVQIVNVNSMSEAGSGLLRSIRCIKI